MNNPLNPLNPLEEIKRVQEEAKKTGEEVPAIYHVDFSKIKVQVDKNHVNEQGEPRRDVLIHPGKMICHPCVENQLKEALALFFGNKRYQSS